MQPSTSERERLDHLHARKIARCVKQIVRQRAVERQQQHRFPARFAELRLPLLVMHGTADRLVPITGSRALAAGAVNADVTTHYYEGLYHEILNEPERQQVIGDLLAWLDGVLQ